MFFNTKLQFLNADTPSVHYLLTLRSPSRNIYLNIFPIKSVHNEASKAPVKLYAS